MTTLPPTRVGDGRAKVYHSFKLDNIPYGRFIRILVRMKAWVAPPGALVQRLVEIEQYRHFAPLSLPLVRALSGELSGLEHDIAEVTQSMAVKEVEDTEEKLQRELTLLSRIMGNIERISAQAYRLSATEAYAKIVATRVSEIGEGRLEGFQKMEEFLDRRMTPAIEPMLLSAAVSKTLPTAPSGATPCCGRGLTCGSSYRTTCCCGYEERAGMQLRLQETVELLSIAAITYYLVSLLSYFLGGIEQDFIKAFKSVLLTVSVPIIAGFLFIVLRRARHRLKQPRNKEETLT